MPKHDVQKLLSQAHNLSASGFDWRAIALEYGPVVLQVLMTLAEKLRTKQGGEQPPTMPPVPIDPHIEQKANDLVSAIQAHPDHYQATA